MMLERYCTCGAVLKRTVERSKKQQALIVWYDQHSGDGHEDCDAAEAERIRMGFSVAAGREARDPELAPLGRFTVAIAARLCWVGAREVATQPHGFVVAPRAQPAARLRGGGEIDPPV